MADNAFRSHDPRRPCRPRRCGSRPACPGSEPDERARLPPLRLAQPAGRGRGPRLDHRRRRRPRVPRRRRRARSSSTSATGGARSPPSSRSRRPASSYAHGSAFTTEPLERYAAEVGAAPADGRSGDLPGLGRVRGDRDGAQAGPRHPDRPRRDRTLGRDLALEQLPRQHAGRARPVRAQAAAPPVRGLARALRARQRGLPVPRRRAGLPGRWRPPRSWPTSWSGRSRPPDPAPWRRSSPSRSSGRRWAPSSRPTATGRRSRRCAAGTACCSSRTRS